MKSLFVYLNGKKVGLLCQNQGHLSFQYFEDILSPLALQFPVQSQAFGHDKTEPFFSGLLPDEPIRSNIARILKISAKNTFELLRHLGGDCAGAIQIIPEGEPEVSSLRQKTLPLTNDKLFLLLRELPQRPLGIGVEGFRISGAGAQDKLVLTKTKKEGWCLPLYGYPSTHIIKPNIQGFPDSVLNEYFCMRLAQKVGIQVPNVEIITLKGHHFYAIERYDRSFSSKMIIRHHQEDFCQLLGIPPNQKYQNEGGPSIQQMFEIMQIFQKQGRMKGTDTIRLLRLILFNFMIGNGDAHGKNFSILYRDNRVELAPGYDLLSTLVYGSYHTEKMAMKIGSKYKFKDVALRYFEQLGQNIGLSPKLVIQQGKKLGKQVRLVSSDLLQEIKNQGYQSQVLDEIVKIIHKQVGLFGWK